jgi:hypothetical protein
MYAADGGGRKNEYYSSRTRQRDLMEKHGVVERKLTSMERNQQRQEEMVRSTLSLTQDLALIQRGCLEGASSGIRAEDQKHVDLMKKHSREARNRAKAPPRKKKPGKLERYLDDSKLAESLLSSFQQLQEQPRTQRSVAVSESVPNLALVTQDEAPVPAANLWGKDLPVISMISPRTKRRVKQMPKPNKTEMEALRRVQDEFFPLDVKKLKKECAKSVETSPTRADRRRGRQEAPAPTADEKFDIYGTLGDVPLPTESHASFVRWQHRVDESTTVSILKRKEFAIPERSVLTVGGMRTQESIDEEEESEAKRMLSKTAPAAMDTSSSNSGLVTAVGTGNRPRRRPRPKAQDEQPVGTAAGSTKQQHLQVQGTVQDTVGGVAAGGTPGNFAGQVAGKLQKGMISLQWTSGAEREKGYQALAMPLTAGPTNSTGGRSLVPAGLLAYNGPADSGRQPTSPSRAEYSAGSSLIAMMPDGADSSAATDLAQGPSSPQHSTPDLWRRDWRTVGREDVPLLHAGPGGRGMPRTHEEVVADHDAVITKGLSRELEAATKQRAQYVQAEEGVTGYQWAVHGAEVVASAMHEVRAQERSAVRQLAVDQGVAAALKRAQEELPSEVLVSAKLNTIAQSRGLAVITRLFARLFGQVTAMALHRWIEFNDAVDASLKAEAGETINRVCRGRLARMEAREQRKALIGQVKGEQDRVDGEVAERIKGCMMLQAAIRGVHGRRRAIYYRNLLGGASAIQRRWRVHTSCVTVTGKRARKKRHRWAAESIQRVFRGHLGRTKRRVLLKIEGVKKREKEERQREERAAEKLKREGAALRIQQRYRERNYYLQCKRGRAIRRSALILRSQSRARVWLAKQRVKQRHKEIANMESAKIDATLVMQRMTRCWKARRKAKQLKIALEMQDKNRKDAVVNRQKEKKFKIPLSGLLGKALGSDEGISINITGMASKYQHRKHNFFTSKKKQQKAALTLQKVFRGHRARKRQRHYKNHEWERLRRTQNRKKKKAATTITAGWRGYLGRTRCKLMRRNNHATTLQRRWRGWMGRADARYMFNSHNAATLIQSRYKGSKAYRDFRKFIKTRRIENVAMVKIQAIARGRYARFYACERADKLRWVAEWRLVCVKRLKVCWWIHLRRMLIEMSKGFKKNDQDNDLGTLFQQNASSVNNMQVKSSAFAKMLNACTELSHGPKATKIDSSAVDLIFSKCKENGTQHLTFKQFVHALIITGLKRYPEYMDIPGIPIVDPKSPKKGGRETTMEKMKREEKEKKEEKAAAEAKAAGKTVYVPRPTTADIEKADAAAKAKAEADALAALPKQSDATYPTTILVSEGQPTEHGCMKGEDAALLRMLLDHIYKSKGSKKQYKKLQRHVDLALDEIATVCQRVYRGVCGRRAFAAAWDRREEGREMHLRHLAAKSLQRAFRMKNSRNVLLEAAKCVFRKYTDPDSKCKYWYNPRTGFLSWTKPLIFGESDCEFEYMVPTEWNEFKLICVNCDENYATKLDEKLIEPYCQWCFDALHRRGHMAENPSLPIFLCGDCNEQTATRREWVGTTMKNRCDTCHISTVRNPRHKKHRVDDLVCRCSECSELSAKWRCDGELFCTGCLSKVFNKGHKTRQTPEFTPYCTPTQQAKVAAELDALKRAQFRERRRLLREAAHEKKLLKAVVFTQTVFRGKLGRKNGKWTLKMGRMQDRRNYRQRKKDDQLRKGAFFKMADRFGVAPKLKSDTLEEQALRGISRKKRKKMLKAIAGNQTDDQPGDPKKIRLKGFAVGTLDDLVEQAKLGGTRLAGTVTVTEDSKEVATTSDLSRKHMLKKGTRVRIGKYIFTIDKETDPTATELKLSEKWIEETMEGQHIFKMPKLKGVTKIKTAAWNDFKQNKEYQNYLRLSSKVEGKLSKALGKAAAKVGGDEAQGFMARRMKAISNNLEGRARKNKNRMITDWVKEKDDRTGDERAAEDTKALDAADAAKQARKKNAYMGAAEDPNWMEEAGWKEGIDEESGKMYWFNEASGESVWEKPKKPKKEKAAAGSKEDIQNKAMGGDLLEKQQAERRKKMEKMKANKAKKNKKR